MAVSDRDNNDRADVLTRNWNTRTGVLRDLLRSAVPSIQTCRDGRTGMEVEPGARMRMSRYMYDNPVVTFSRLSACKATSNASSNVLGCSKATLLDILGVALT